MDAQRALLDELMGRNRDGDRPEEEITDYRDKRVCKRFLCGLCPHDLFQNTKMDLGECAKLHPPKLKDKYDLVGRDLAYEQELERDLVKYINEVERKIARAQKRLEEQDGERAPSIMDVENCKEVLEITAEIQEVMLKAEEAGNEGEVDLSMELMNQVEELQKKKATAQANAMLRSFKGDGAARSGENGQVSGAKDASALPNIPNASVNQKLRVCDVCGAFLSIFDSDRRLADHFGGKLHLGYLQIRKKIEEIAAYRRERRQATGSTASSTSAPPNNSDRSRARRDPPAADRDRRRDRESRSRSRSRRDSRRDRDRGRDRSRDRSRRRHRRRSSSRSPSRSRSRSRGRRR